MVYYQIPDTNEVVGFNETDTDGINQAIANGWIETTFQG
jgi:hypothetical protein